MDPVSRTDLEAQLQRAIARPWFFVCGAPKSGTTWVQRLLDAHPELVCAGEGHFADRLAQGLAQTFNHYNSQQQTVAELVYENDPYYAGLGQREFDYALESLMGLVMSQRPIPAGTRRLGDKTPRYTFYLDALWRVRPEARVIHIIRDGRDVVVSTLHHAKRSGVEDALDPASPNFLKYVEQYAEVWRDNVATARQHGGARPGQYQEIRYEALHSDPLGTLRQIARFLDVDDSESVCEACREAADFKKLAERQGGRTGEASFLRKGVAGDWRNFLGPKEIEVIELKAGDLLRELGYN